MKKMKKILAMLLAFTMILGMTMTASASSQTIKVTLPTGSTEENTEVYSKQIIVEDRVSTLGWKFVDTFKTPFVKAFLEKTDASYTATEADEDLVITALIKLGQLEDVNNFVKNGLINTDVDVNNDELGYVANTLANSDNLGKALVAVQDLIDTKSVDVFDEIKVDTENIGLYGIKVARAGYTFIPMAVYVGTGFETLTVTAKGSEDQIKKALTNEVDQSVSAGDVVEYTVNVEYPYYSTDAEEKTFIVTDTLTNATFPDENNDKVADDLLIKVGTTDLENGKDYTAVLSSDNVLTITFAYNTQYAGEGVVITYSAVAGDVTSTALMHNEVTSETATETGAKYTKQVVISETVTFTVTKVDKDNVATKLGDAEFTLYVEDENGDIELTYGEATVNLSVVAAQTTENDTTLDTFGTTTFEGLDAQKTYYVQETRAPKGYSLHDELIRLTGAAKNETETTVDVKTTETVGEGADAKTYTVLTTTYVYDDFDGVIVKDTKLIALPSTGGIGTTIFTVAGCGIMIAAAYFFFASRKKEN